MKKHWKNTLFGFLVAVTVLIYAEPRIVDATGSALRKVLLFDLNGRDFYLTAQSDAPVALRDANGRDLELTTNSNVPVEPQTDYILEVTKGNVSGHEGVYKFGNNPDIDTGTDPEDVWSYGGLYTFSTSADIDSFSSSSSSDTFVIAVFGLDSNWDEVIQLVTLTGQTTTTCGTSMIRVNRMVNASATAAVGTIYCYVNGATVAVGVPTTATDVRAVIDIGYEQTQMAIYSVPAGKTAYIYQITFSMEQAVGVSSGALISVRQRAFGRLLRNVGQFALQEGGSSFASIKFTVPVLAEEKNDLLMRCETVGANNIGISGMFNMLQVDN